MKKIYTWNSAVVIILFSLITNLVNAQTKLVLNGAKINIANGASLVLANPAPDALVRRDGHIISEGENNLVKWNLSNSTGTYTIPFGFGASNYLPLTFTKSAGNGPGHYLFSTYQTTWQNSTSLPTGVTNLNSSNQDNSEFVLDRFWRVEAKEFATSPSITNLSFTYLESELNDANNQITESRLGLQGWNNNSKSWSDFQPLGEVDVNTNTLTVASFPSGGPYTWWALVDKTTPLPLEFISFEARKSGSKVNLLWVTANEINCRNFDIQRSLDGINFTTFASKIADNASLNHYKHMDLSPLNGTSYYRLKQNNNDGTFTYTPIRSVTSEALTKVTIYPNPAAGNKVQVVFGELPMGKYSIALLDLNGSVIFTSDKNINQDVFQIEFPATVKPGMYLIKFFNNAFSSQVKLVLN